MKIKEIIVEKLFDTFDHTISLNTQERITLMLGENGFGKTVLLEMINALFNQNFYYFQSVVFKRFQLKFEDNLVWEVIKSDNEITLRLFENNDLKESVFVFDSNKVLPEWFTERVSLLNIRLVDTQRLLVIAESLPTTFQAIEHTNRLKTDVEKETQKMSQATTILAYANELAENIKSHFAKSMELATKLDSTYPSRLAKNRHQYDNISAEHLKAELQQLEQKRQLFHLVGLLEQEENTAFLDDEHTEKFMIPVLMVYIDDSKQKLQIFENLAQKLKCFLGIINNRFYTKQCRLINSKDLFSDQP
ncbi:excinuclease ATPase subunit [Beggiatoa sp. PS]|nr:excinuclease ATPase subunit [Beggiatoa sp. PS]